MDNNFQEGQLILIDKELKWTSFDAVNKIRIILRKRLGINKIKVGHAGTLDPLATGLIIVCTGKMTKQIPEFQELDKEYEAVLKLGGTTPSFDLETEIDNYYPYQHINEQRFIEVLKSFTGEIEQVPPLFSAKFINGTRAYEYARSNRKYSLKSQKIKIYSINLIKFDLPVVKIRICCSKGTYIRSLVNDIGKALKSGAHLTELRRIRIGLHDVSNALTINAFENSLELIPVKIENV